MNKLLISCKETRIEKNRSFYGCFNLGPFEAGQSLTVANALRRTLLSECTGLAIISVVIENVHHEYSTLPGVRDSVLDILLNLKEIVLKKTKNPYGIYKKNSLHSVYEGVGNSYFKPVVGYLKARGPGVIRAKDLRLPPFIQCVDPEQYIATLGDDGFFNMKFIVMEGKNYILGKNTRESSFLKKRETLLKGLKNVMNLHTAGGKKVFSDFDLLTANPLSGESPLSSTSQGTALQRRDWTENFCKNASQLYLDAVFNPVTKVNYIIEVNENKLVENSTKKYSLLEDITALMNSTEHLKAAFPFSLPPQALSQSVSKISEGNFTSTVVGSGSTPGGTNSELKFPEGILPSILTSGSVSSEGKKKKNGSLSDSESEHLTKELIEYVENFSTVELNNLYNSLHPLKKDSTTHNIILEIWTNGSLHPRDALSMAFFNLANVFLNLQQTEILNPVFNDWGSYKKALDTFTSTRGTETPDIQGSKDHLEEHTSFVSGRPQVPGVYSRTMDSYKNLDISTLNISLRAYTKLKRENIHKIGDLLSNWSDISTNIEKKLRKEIKDSLKEIGLSLD